MKARLALFALATLVFGHSLTNAQDVHRLVNGQTGQPIEIVSPDAAAAATMIPLWEYSTKSPRDGNTYTGMMVGRDPFAHGHTKTTVPAYLIPLKIVMPDGKPFDPAVATGCLVDNNQNKLSVQAATVNSPIFEVTTWMMNGVNVGSGIPGQKTQYGDAFQRANFWGKPPNKGIVGGTPYQTLLAFNPNTNIIAGQVAVVPDNNTGVYFPGPKGGNCFVGFVSQGWFYGVVEGILAMLSAQQNAVIKPTAFPLIVVDSIVLCDKLPVSETDPGIKDHCILGYHSSYEPDPTNPNLFQTYAEADFDTSGELDKSAPDVDVISHEVGEWMDNPITAGKPVANGEGQVAGNPAPAWGGVGQVPAGTCQGNVEVGDPTSMNFAKDFSVPLNNFNYHLQELTFYSWFFGGNSIAAGGLYSNNGSFNKDAGKVCVAVGAPQ